MELNIFALVGPADIVAMLQIEQDLVIAARKKATRDLEIAEMDPKARYRAKNRASLRYKEAKRRAKNCSALLPWLTDDQEQDILNRYISATERESATGIGYDVHHKAPLVGKCPETGQHVVCGLHVPWNLKVLERSHNQALGDLFESDWPAQNTASDFDHGDDEIPW